jgi:hypothetical protein
MVKMPDEDISATEMTISNTNSIPPTESFTTHPSEDEDERKAAKGLSSDDKVEDTMALSVATITAQANSATEDPVTDTADDPVQVQPHHAAAPLLSPGDIVAHLESLDPRVLTRTGESTFLGEPPEYRRDHKFEHPAVLGLYPANSPGLSYDGLQYGDGMSFRGDAVFSNDAYRSGELQELASFIKPYILDAIAKFDSEFPPRVAAR